MLLRGRAEVARQAHNLEAVGSIPTPATNLILSRPFGRLFCCLIFSVLRPAAHPLIMLPFVSCLGGGIRRFDPFLSRNRKQIVSKIYTLKRGLSSLVLRLTSYLCSTPQ